MIELLNDVNADEYPKIKRCCQLVASGLTLDVLMVGAVQNNWNDEDYKMAWNERDLSEVKLSFILVGAIKYLESKGEYFKSLEFLEMMRECEQDQKPKRTGSTGRSGGSQNNTPQPEDKKKKVKHSIDNPF